MKYTCQIPNKVVVCVSGGIDSIAVAHMFSRQRERDVTFYHFNHGTKQANQMEERVKLFAEFVDKPLIIKRADKVLSTESEFREARFKFFETGEERWNVVTAHHLNDCVETYLMNCFRGHNNWKVPMSPTSCHKNFTVYHPFLLRTKESFQNYCVKNDLTKFICEDETNKQNVCRRNFIRNSIVPILKSERIHLEKIVKKQYLFLLQGGYHN